MSKTIWSRSLQQRDEENAKIYWEELFKTVAGFLCGVLETGYETKSIAFIPGPSHKPRQAGLCVLSKTHASQVVYELHVNWMNSRQFALYGSNARQQGGPFSLNEAFIKQHQNHYILSLKSNHPFMDEKDRNKLLAVLVRDLADYLKYARTADGPEMLNESSREEWHHKIMACQCDSMKCRWESLFEAVVDYWGQGLQERYRLNTVPFSKENRGGLQIVLANNPFQAVFEIHVTISESLKDSLHYSGEQERGGLFPASDAFRVEAGHYLFLLADGQKYLMNDKFRSGLFDTIEQIFTPYLKSPQERQRQFHDVRKKAFLGS